MAHGADSTLILNPTGLPALAFNTGLAPTGGATATYTVDLGRLHLHETDRLRWDYEQNALGGSVFRREAALVPVTFPALLRLTAAPASGQRLGRLIAFRRGAGDGTLANLVSVYEAEDAVDIYPISGWSPVSAATRGVGAYLRCAPFPTANGEPQGLRLTIQNPTEAEGRFAVFGVGSDHAAALGTWTHQVKLRAGNVVQTGGSYQHDEGTAELVPDAMSDAFSRQMEILQQQIA